MERNGQFRAKASPTFSCQNQKLTFSTLTPFVEMAVAVTGTKEVVLVDRKAKHTNDTS